MNENLKIIISAEIENLKKNVDNAKKQVKSFKEQVADAKKNVDADFKAAGSAIKTGLGIGIGAMAAAGAALLSLSAATEEYRANQAKLTTAFETAGASASTAKETYNDLYRVLGDGGKATEAAAHLAKLTTEEKALNEWTTICQGVYATFGDSLPIEALTEAANETAKTGALTGGLADALNWAGVSEEAFQEKLDACNTEAEREKLIRDTLNGIYDEAAAKYEKNAAATLAQNEAQAKLDATMATLGETMQPINTALTSLANDVLAALTPYIQQFAEQYLPIIQEILGDVGSKLETALTWLREHQTILAVMGGIIGTIVAAIGLYNAVAAVKAAMDAAQVATLGGLIAAHIAHAAAVALSLAPYIAIVAAIAAVIAIIVLCVKNWDKIKEKIKEVADKVKKWIEDMVAKVKDKIQQMVNAVKEKFEAIKTSIQEKINAAKQKVLDIFNNIKSGITEKINAIKSSVSTTMENVKTAMMKPIEKGRDLIKGIIDKIKGFFNFTVSLPKIKLPHFSITPSGWSVGDLLKGSIPKLGISWYAKGGIFDKPTLFGYGNGMLGGLGENGAEAVVPLEKNTEWLTKIAKMLSAEMGGNQPIYLQVDGKTFAEVAVNSINDLTKLRGSLPLKLV